MVEVLAGLFLFALALYFLKAQRPIHYKERVYFQPRKYILKSNNLIYLSASETCLQ